MDGTVFDTIVRALNTIYSGASADRAEFARAQEVCEAFKSDPNAYQYGILLAHKNSGHNDFQRHYGLALVEHTVRFRWGWGSSQTGVALSEGAQNELRDKLLALLREGLRDDGTEARFIEEKLAAVISSLIIRMWPSEQWPTLHADLLQLYNSASPLKQQLVLTIFRQLCEEVFHADRDPVAALRSFDITTGLYSIIYPTSDLREKFPNGIRVGNKKRKAIKVWVEEGNEEGWFGRWVGTTRQLVASLSANPVERGSGDYQQALKVLGDCIDTITACVTFVPVTVVQRLGVLSLLAELFPVVDYDIRARAVACFECLTSSALTTFEERQNLIEEIVDNHDSRCLKAFYSAYMATLQDTEDPDELAFARSLSTVLANLGASHLAFKKNQGWLPKHFVSWAELVLTIAKDPRPSVAATSGMFWTAILQHTNLARLQTVTKTIPAVLGVYMQHWLWAKVTLDNLSKRGRHAEYPEEDTTWSSLDEYKSFISSGIRNRAQRIFSLIAILDIAGMNRWLYERLAETIRALSATAQSLDEALAGNIDAKNQAVVILEMTRHTSMELKSKKVHAVEVGDEELSEELDRAEASLAEMLTLICQLQTIHPEVVQHICSAFVSFAFILKDPSRHDLLNAVLQKLSGYVQQLLSSSNRRDGHEPMPLDYSSVEIRGLSTLISLAEEIPDEMIKFYNEWAKLIAMAPSVPSRYASVFRRMVIELHLAMASQGSLSVSDRQKMARPAMEQVVLLWRESTGGISTPVGLLDLLGVPELDTMHCDTGEDGIVSLEAWVRFCDTKIQTVSQLHQAAEMLYMALKRTVGDPRTGGSSAGGPPAQVRIRDSLTVWSEFIPELVPSLLLLVRCLHALWNTRVYWDGLPWKSQAARTTEDRMGVLGLPPDERGQIIRNLVATADGPHTSSAEPAESKQQHKLLASLRSQNVGHLATPQEREAFIVRARGAVSRHICQGISSVLTVLYKCLGILCKMPQVYQLPGLGESFVGSMFSDIHYLPLQHMGHMLARAVYQILDNMAGEVADSFVSELLPPLFEFMRARIHGEWLGLQERGLTLTSKSELEELAASGTAAADEGDVSEDIIQEKIVRTWTYQWAKIIGLLLGKLRNLYPPTDALAADLRHESEVLSPPVAGDKARALQLQAAIRATDADDLWNRVGRLFMSSPGLMGGLLGCVAQMVTVKDTPSVHATLTNLAAVIPPLLVSALSFDYEPATGAAGRQRDRPYLGILSADLAGPVLSWLSTDLPSSVMAMLQDPYFTDHYNLGITILGDLAFYSSAFRGTAKWRLRAGHTEGTESDPHYVFKREFIGALGRRTGCDEARLARLFDLWTDEADTKSRRALGRVEFEGFMGVDKGQIFKYSEGTQTGHGAASAKTIAFNLPNQSGLSGSTKTTKKNVGGSGGELFEQDSDFSLNSVMP